MPYFPPNTTGIIQTVNKILDVDMTTTSTAFSTVISQIIGTQGNSYLLIRASLATSDSASLATFDRFQVRVDGVVYAVGGNEIFTCIQGGSICARVGPLVEGEHLVDLRWQTSAGNTMRCRPLTQAEHASLMISEVTV